jgi:hypothetical protein
MATMENYDVRSNKDRVRALADYIEEIAREILASNEKLDRREMSEARDCAGYREIGGGRPKPAGS